MSEDEFIPIICFFQEPVMADKITDRDIMHSVMLMLLVSGISTGQVAKSTSEQNISFEQRMILIGYRFHRWMQVVE